MATRLEEYGTTVVPDVGFNCRPSVGCGELDQVLEVEGSDIGYLALGAQSTS